MHKGPCSSICQGRNSYFRYEFAAEYLLLLQVRRLSTGTGVKRLGPLGNSSSTVGAGDRNEEVKCPKCDSLFEIDASGYADIVKQIRGDEFETELNIRLQEVESKHDMGELAQQSIASEKDKEILTLRNEIANHAREIEIAKAKPWLQSKTTSLLRRSR